MGIKRFGLDLIPLAFILLIGTSTQPAQAEAFRVASAVPHLYAVQSDGKLSFIFGTRHNRIPLSTFPDFVFQALRSRSLVATEILHEQSGTPSPNPTENSKNEPLLPKPVPISMPSPQAVAALKTRGLPDYLYTNPWVCVLYLTWESTPGPILDKALESLARQLGKPLTALDEKVDTEKIRTDLDHTVNSCDIENLTRFMPPQKLQADFEESLNTYFSGDLSLDPGCSGHCAERSKKWIAKLEKLHSQGGFFALFGVGHFAGEEGVIALLRGRGHQVTQVRNLAQLHELLRREKQAQRQN